MPFSRNQDIVASLTELASTREAVKRPSESNSYPNWYSIQVSINALDWKRDTIVNAFQDVINEAGLAEQLKGKFIIHVSKDGEANRAITFLNEDQNELMAALEAVKQAAISAGQDESKGRDEVPPRS